MGTASMARTNLILPLLLLLLLPLLASAAPPRTIEPPPSSAAAAPASSQMAAGDSGVTDAANKVCHISTPCGWAVYGGYPRVVLYFVENTCECPADRRCTKAEDDLSARAFVYRCTTVSSSDATTTPADGRSR